jgi:outer membrane protein OmpA-like peptidoglycan-associated protein
MSRFLLLSLLALLVVGCGGPPRDNPMLNDARAAYGAAESDEVVVRNAAVALAEAREALDRAETVWRQKEDMEVVNHYTYVAQQRIRIAQETARLNAAGRAIEAARTERQEVLLEARAAEARAAESSAETARARAEQERMAAEAAQARAEEALARARELAQRVNDLEAELTSRGLVLTLGDVLFDTGQATLLAGAQRAITGLVQFLRDYPERNVLIEGHTDNVGSDATNQALSERRANSVREALIAQGISATRIRTLGLGERYPVSSNDTPAGRQQNRRVEIIISDPQGIIPDRTN